MGTRTRAHGHVRRRSSIALAALAGTMALGSAGAALAADIAPGFEKDAVIAGGSAGAGAGAGAFAQEAGPTGAGGIVESAVAAAQGAADGSADAAFAADTGDDPTAAARAALLDGLVSRHAGGSFADEGAAAFHRLGGLGYGDAGSGDAGSFAAEFEANHPVAAAAIALAGAIEARQASGTFSGATEGFGALRDIGYGDEAGGAFAGGAGGVDAAIAAAADFVGEADPVRGGFSAEATGGYGALRDAAVAAPGRGDAAFAGAGALAAYLPTTREGGIGFAADLGTVGGMAGRIAAATGYADGAEASFAARAGAVEVAADALADMVRGGLSS